MDVAVSESTPASPVAELASPERHDVPVSRAAAVACALAILAILASGLALWRAYQGS